MASKEVTLKAVNAIAEVPASAWDACANPPAAETTAEAREIAGKDPQARSDCGGVAIAPAPSKLKGSYNPFISHAFLSSLEASGSVRSRTGWQPMHLIAEAAGGELIGAVPCYAKSHSQGEY